MLLPKRYAFLLRPLSYLYGLGVAVRNLAFDWGILREQTYPIPIICVGNISVGGTGKTPHIEYILSQLYGTCRIALISRGYKRRSRGLVLASAESTASEIGDEPKQILLKYPKITAVIDGNRRRAMDYLLSLPEDERPDVVLMDDGLQHRYVKASYKIMLMDAGNPLDEDKLLPEGTLREPMSARYRMDCIIVTKCPSSLKPIERRGIERSLALYSYQPVFFTSMEYLPLRPLVALGGNALEGEIQRVEEGNPLLLLSGIAQPEQFRKALEERYPIVEEMRFEDHHSFAEEDLDKIIKCFTRLKALHPKLKLVCTEKDAVRLIEHSEALAELTPQLYYLPMQVKVLQGQDQLNRLILLATKVKPQSLQELK